MGLWRYAEHTIYNEAVCTTSRRCFTLTRLRRQDRRKSQSVTVCELKLCTKGLAFRRWLSAVKEKQLWRIGR